MTTVTRRGIIIVPRQYAPNWDITINGINIDDELESCEINRMVTEGTGNFSITLLNPNAGFNFTGLEEVIVNADFGGGTTRFFRGTVEEVKKTYSDVPKIRLNGRHISGELADLTVTETFSNTELSSIFTSIVNTYAPNYTVNNVNSTGILDSIAFDHMPFYQALKEIAYRADFDYYVDNDRNFHFFKSGSIRNMTDAIGPTWFISSEGLGDSIVEVKNRIICYGTTSSGLPIISTVDDSNSQGLYGVREKFISDSRITSKDIADAVINAYLQFNKNKNQIGTVDSYALPTLLPGDKIYIEERSVGITGQFRINHITDRIGNDGWFTKVNAERIGSVRLSSILGNLFKSSSGVDFKNPNKMKYSIVDEFDNSVQIESSANANISNSEFRQTALGSDAQITGITADAIVDITQVELRVSGQDLDGSVFAVSTDNGANYASITPNVLTSVASGREIKVRITLRDNSTNLLPILKGYSLLLR